MRVDQYSSFDHLQDHEREGIDYRVRWRIGSSGIAVLCIHGGLIEPGTSRIADGIAGSEHTFYALEGLKQAGNRVLHITSTAFDEPIALEIVCEAEIIISIHGCSDEEPVVYLGGLDHELRRRIQQKLSAAGFRALLDAHPGLQGVEQGNVCNLCGRGMGVQLEISRGLRARMFKDLTPEGSQVSTETFTRFVQAVREALEPLKSPAAEWAESAGSESFP
jgi:phage replication-related protein YjqB (UPF0714/DUF867 family)